MQGWEPDTVYEYDADGRLLRSRPEPEWDEEQAGLVMAWTTYQDELHTCGHPLSETTLLENQGRYKIPDPTRCHACDAIELKQEDYKTAIRPRALLWRAELP